MNEVIKLNLKPLLIGAVVGLLLYFLVTGIVINKPILAGPLAIFSYVIVGLVSGIVSQLLLNRDGSFPKLSWALLALINWISLPLGFFVTGLIIAILFQVNFQGQMELASQVSLVIGPLLAFGLWLVVGYYSLKALTKKRQSSTSSYRILISIVGMILLAIFIAFSWLAGMGTLMLGGMIGLFGMFLLAMYGTTSRPFKKRSPGFLIGLWIIPAISIASLALLFLSELL